MHYHLLSVLFALAAVILGCLATPRWNDLRMKHAWKAVPENWEYLGLPPASSVINLHIALKPRRANALIEALFEVAELVMPHPHTLELVKSWLKYHGVPSSISLTHGGNWLTLTGVSVSKANDLLGASYRLYRHTETNETIVRTIGFSLPAVLHAHVQTVAPTTYFASPRMSLQTPRMRSSGAAAGQVKAASGDLVTALSRRADGDGDDDDDDVLPSTLHWLYKSFPYVPAATDRNVLGIAGYVGEYPNRVDLTTFMDHFHGPETEATYTVVQVNNGGYDPMNPGVEANMNIQYASGMAYPTPITYYSVGNEPDGEDDPYLSWLNYMLDLDEIPQTISTSYANKETNWPLDHARSLCDLFMQLGARGVSVLFASGNDGVGAGDCMTNGNVRFMPTFPASCPWVTAVGGTTRYEPEIAADLSGGGFSDYFKRPDYQDEAVTTFFENIGNMYQGLYNASGRGLPDIAAQAYRIGVIFRGKYKVVEGTSCATPLTANVQIVAGIISLLNDYRISQGRHPLGFLNPWLYGIARAGWNDITSGSNPGCNTDGFPAVVGWDPVTGLGSPDFEHLQHLLP
ncbi:subtilisin-like protein [Lactarius akahatsu]|uniref:tripeptidyl-peptidase II n=1 Tax=Lactarius akahatsu TaxID=416441 RepID=A0AAD4LFY6_9AGAM|nr:subtilisin-like protein [Lactarius akahatsu]